MNLLLADINYFVRTFIIQVKSNDGKNPPYCQFPVTEFTNEEPAGCINEEVIDGINKAAIGHHSNNKSTLLLFYLMFYCFSGTIN